MLIFRDQPAVDGPRSRLQTSREVFILRVLCVTFLVCTVGLLAGLIVNQQHHKVVEHELVKFKREKRAASSTTSTDTQSTTVHNVRPADYSNPDVFLSLSADEINRVREYLFKQEELNLTLNGNATFTDNYIHMMEYSIPPKKKVISYLNGQSVKPLRWAEVTIFRGGDDPPVVQTLRVGPLPQVISHKDISTEGKKKFDSRLEDTPEFNEVTQLFQRTLSPRLIEILRESFNSTPSWIDCTSRCFSFFASNTKGVSQGRRVSWYRFMHLNQANYFFPFQFNLEVDKTGMDSTKWTVNRVYYNGLLFHSLTHFEESYNNNHSIRLKDHAGYEDNNRHFTFPRRHNNRTARRDGRPEPVQVHPGGNRFNVDGNRVTYMDWEFRYLVQSSKGLHLFDIRFDRQRIAYEISLQELLVTYAAAEPTVAGTTFLDSNFQLGLLNFALVRGVDCPHSAVMLDVVNYHSDGGIFHAKNAICLFEWNTQLPIKRHFANEWNGEYSFYGGHSDTVLVMRIIATVGNYDYIIDYMLHHNGVIEVRTSATGYVWAVSYYPEELKYGRRLADGFVAPLHTHLFNFKIDMDINGEENCFETIDIGVDESTSAPFDASEQMRQMTFKRNLRRTEAEALIKYNFDEPKYFLFYNRDVNNSYGIPRAYRLHGAPFAKLLLPEGAGRDPGVSWARHQIVVTKQKDTEQRTTDVYSNNNFDDPVINFTTFYADNESLEQQDLVAWITLGFHHLPHTEDLPSTSTVATKANFMLLPYNYFDEDPSMVENNLVLVELDPNSKKPNVTTYAEDVTNACSSGVNLDEYEGKYFP